MTHFDKNILATGAFIMAATIMIGAFGAHGLKEILDPGALATFEVGVRYQTYHALAILGLGLAGAIPNNLRKKVFWFFVFGILLFSGSIYLLSLDSILPFESSGIGFVTPLGGLMFIIGWILLGYKLLTLKSG